MIRALLRLIAGAVLSALLFTVLSLALGYVAITVFKWHAPLSERAELAGLQAGATLTFPFIAGLVLLGMLFAWSDARRFSMRLTLVLACACGLILAVLFTLEDIPRSNALWLADLLPVVAVAVSYWCTRLLGRRGQVPAV